MVNFAKAYPEISAVYLFGSHALGHPRSKSDIDLEILFHKDMDAFTRISMETEISNLLKKDFDLVDMRKSSPFLCHQIYKYGKFIYHDGSNFPFQFRASSIREYLDTNYLRTKRRANRYG
ncbi:MAG: nucleotidyltransferase domain-containing protein [Deltaproteobacteria bacterium]|nr:nucleotidyltransferase domain-containing protein [Deltaproteobacteria bacterium]